MKKFFSPIPDGGFPIYSQEINSVMQEQIWTPIEAQMTALCFPLAGMIVSGGVITDGGATFDIAAGVCFLDGEYLEFDAQTGLTSPAYIKVSTPITTNTAYADTVSRGYTVLNKAEVVDADPGGQKIIVNKDDTTFLYFRNYIAKLQDINDITDDRDAERRSRPILVAKVDDTGVMTVLYKQSGTWTASSIGTGIYQIKRDGSVVSNLPVILTVETNGIDAAYAASYETTNGHVTIQNITSGSYSNAAFNIVAYPTS